MPKTAFIFPSYSKGNVAYSKEQLSQFAKRPVDMLMTLRILQSATKKAYDCDACQDEHPFTEWEGTWFKVCPQDESAIWQTAPEESRTEWIWDLEKLRQIICEQRLLGIWQQELPWEWAYPIGAASSILTLLVNIRSKVPLKRYCQELNQNYPQHSFHFIIPNAFILTAEDQSYLSHYNVTLVTFEDLLKTGWRITALPEQSKIEPKTIFHINKRELILLGRSYIFPSNKQFLAKTTRIIIEGNGAIVSESDFLASYYNSPTRSNTEAGVSLNNYANKAERLIKKALSESLNGSDFLINAYGSGYRLNNDFLPAETR